MTETPSGGPLVVPVANPETTSRLIDTAISIATGRSLEIIVLHVVEVPPQVPLSEGSRLIDDDGEVEAMLAEATAMAADAGVTAESRIRYARDVATGISGSINSYDASGLLVGWRGRPRRRDIILGSFIDRLLGEAPCDVYVKRIRQPTRDIDSILVPVSGGPHAELAVDLAGVIAGERGATVQLLHVQQPDASDATHEQAIDLLSETASILANESIAVDTSIVEGDHVAGTITDETVHHDVTILGATRDSFLKRKLVGSVAEGVGRAAASSVILARRSPRELDR